MRNPRASFYVALFVAFVDYMGLGLIYPLFSSMLFDVNLPILHPETSQEMRGFWLGILLALMPLAQFFSSPMWGALSDSKGRRAPLLWSLGIALVGYITAFSGVFLSSIFLLLVSRVIIGCAAGNISVVQATIADISTPEEKAKNFGLYGMALGLGFTLGPFFGGLLSSWNYNIPFLFASLVVALNLMFTVGYFKETNHLRVESKLNWSMGIGQLKKAFLLKGSRTILLASFFHNFGWSYFFEFAPVYLISRFHFTPKELGFFFAAGGCYYALSTGLLIRSLIKRLKPETLFFGGIFLTACTLFILPCLPSSYWIWPIMFVICYFVAFVTPTSTTIISNNAPPKVQGEALGILASVNAAALVLSPLFSGSLVGINPTLPMWVGGSTMIVGACIVLAVFRSRLFKLPSS
jgi:DHA1 family tetracycline resistance protein-like MFS transporter